MKKLIALVLALVMMLSLALTGCGSTAADPTEAPKNETTPVLDQPEDETPAEPVKLTAWILSSPKVADFQDNWMTQWLEENANVELEMVAIPAADFGTKINMALTVGAIDDLPDIILGSGTYMTTASMLEWSSTGNILSLTEYYQDAELAENINKAIERTGVDYTAQLYMPDGEIYSIGSYNQSYGNEYPEKLWINETWLNQLGMEIPTTLEEFKAVLKAVSETDLNGNGKHDEIPFAGSVNGSYYDRYQNCIMNAFFYSGDKDYVYKVVNDGVVSSAVTTEEFKDSLVAMREMFQEGLILTESLTMSKEQFETLVNTEVNTVFAFSYTSPSVMTDLTRREEYICIEPLIGPEGVQYATYEQSVGQHAMVITANCENPEAAFKVGDLLSSELMGICTRWGQQGVDWDYASDAKDAENWESPFSNFDLYMIAYDASNFWAAKEPTNHFWAQSGPFVRQYAIANGCGVAKGSVSLYTQHTNDAAALLQNGGWAPEEHIPTLIYNDDESIVVSEIQPTLKSYISEYIAAVMVGTKNLEGDWDAFQKELEVIGLSDYLAAVQTAYDRMYK